MPKEHICNVNYWSKIIVPKFNQFKANIGEMNFSDDGKLLNMEEVVEKINRIGKIKPIARGDAASTSIRDIPVKIESILPFKDDELKMTEWRATFAPKLTEAFIRIDYVLTSAFEVLESDRTYMPQIRTQIEETASILKNLNVVSSTKPNEVFNEIMVSLLMHNICDPLNSVGGVQGVRKPYGNLEIKALNKVSGAIAGIFHALTSSSEDCCSCEVLIEELIALSEIVKEIVYDSAIMGAFTTCAYPECYGSYNTLSEKIKEFLFLYCKRARALISFSELVVECLKMRANNDYTIPKDDVERICEGLRMNLLFLASPLDEVSQ